MVTGIFSIALPVDADRSPVGSITDFVGGPENRLVGIAAETLLTDRSANFSPLVFWGPSGCGKTHLVRGLYRSVVARRNTRDTRLLRAHEFTRRIRPDRDLLEDFSAVRWLAIEDIHQLARKPNAQRALARLIDFFAADPERQICLTLRDAPQQTAALLPLLASRLGEGLVVPVQRPSVDVRVELIAQAATQQKVLINESSISALARGLVGSASEVLLGFRELATCSAGTITSEAVRRFLADSRGKQQRRLPRIASLVAKHFSVTVRDLKSASRRQALVQPRSIAMYLSWKITEQSLLKIGRFYGGRDHTTVLHNCRKIEKLAQTDRLLQQTLQELRRQLETA